VSRMSIHFRRTRLILDCLLVLAAIFAIFSYRQPGRANAEQNTQAQAVFVDNIRDLKDQSNSSVPITSTDVTNNTIILANETIAAVIAAENAALTPPQYLTSLPVVTH
jgi:hypothetical protein